MDADSRIARLETRYRRLLILQSALWAALAFGLLWTRAELAVSGQTDAQPQDLRVSSIEVVDPDGVVRARIGLDLPHRRSNGTPFRRRQPACCCTIRRVASTGLCHLLGPGRGTADGSSYARRRREPERSVRRSAERRGARDLARRRCTWTKMDRACTLPNTAARSSTSLHSAIRPRPYAVAGYVRHSGRIAAEKVRDACVKRHSAGVCDICLE